MKTPAQHICKVDSCNKVCIQSTLCSKHWYQINKFGKPVSTSFDPRPAVIEDTYAKLPLGKDAKQGYALIDKGFAYLDAYKWRTTDQGYAVAMIDGKNTKLHRLIMNAEKGQFVDHISLDKLDNRTSNLRFADHAENKWNKPKQANNTSGYKGVYRRGNKWVAKVVKHRKQYHFGQYDTPKEAAKAYDFGASKLFGDFAHLNFKTRNN